MFWWTLFFTLYPLFSANSAFLLSEKCPPLFQKENGKCYYEIPYGNTQPGIGLLRPTPITKLELSPQAIDLGRYLFFDPILSRSQDRSCATCHRINHSLSDGGRSIGPGMGIRSAPPLWNVAFLRLFFWDGRAHSLEDQILGPLFSPLEMGMSPSLIIKRLSTNPNYQDLFLQAFQTKQIRLKHVVTAITSFERTLLSLQSRYDLYVQGQKEALTSSEERGFHIFRSFVTRCAECHTPPLFTNEQVAVVGAPDPKGSTEDLGAGQIIKHPRMIQAFRVPSLRNIAKTAPYMHSGVFHSLKEVIRFYNEGAGRGRHENRNPYIHWHLRPIGLTKEEEMHLSNFLETLTDETCLPEIPKELPSGIKKVP